jgi:polar amino acid transport system permease protein
MDNFGTYLSNLLPLLLKGAGSTISVFLITLASAIPIGLIITLGSISKIPPLRWIADLYIWVFRGTPLMLQLFFMYFFIPIVTNQHIMLDNFTTAAITFALNYAAYFAEIYRGGIQSIDAGQYEAAKSLGFTRWGTMRYIIIPQTIRRVIPAISNESITLIKDTALINVIGAAELLKYAKDSVNTTANATAYAIAALFYLFFTFVLTLASKKLEKVFGKHEQEA